MAALKTHTCCRHCDWPLPWPPRAKHFLHLLIHRIVQCMGWASPYDCWCQPSVQACQALTMEKLSCHPHCRSIGSDSC